MSILRWSAVLACLALAACNSLSPSRMIPPSDPDARVAELMDAWEKAKRGEPADTGLLDPKEPPAVTEIRLLEEAEALALEHPRHTPTLVLCAALSYDLKRTDNAVAHLDTARMVDPSSAEAAILRSQIALDEGNCPFAFRILNEQVSLHPDHPGLMEARAAAFFVNQQTFDALRDLDAAERLGAPGWRIAYNRGLVAEFQQRFDVAAEYYTACLKDRPDYAPAQERLKGVRSAPGPR